MDILFNYNLTNITHNLHLHLLPLLHCTSRLITNNQQLQMLESLLTIAISIPAYKIIRAVLPYLNIPLLYPSVSILPQSEYKHDYVMVTGCTDGIGKQYAKYLHIRGFNLVMVGRNMDKLKSVRDEIQALTKDKDKDKDKDKGDEYKQKDRFKLLQIDYSDESLDLTKHQALINSLELPHGSIVGIVNCCGISHVSKYEYISWSELQTIKRVNTNSLQLCLHALQHQAMLKSKQIRTNFKFPFFINLSSSTSVAPLAYSSIYSACKAYQSSLVSAFNQQQNSTKIKINILSVDPWFVSTKMTGWRKGWDVVSPEQVVQGSMRVLGRKSRCTGTIKHQLLYQFRYLFNTLYFSGIGKSNYERVSKLKQLKQKRIKSQTTKPTQSIEPNSETNQNK